MSTELKPRTWCRPSSEEEWSAILSIAVSLNLGDKESREYHRMPGVGVVSRRGKWRVGACAWPLERPDADFPEVPVADFIIAMYAEAERRKSEKPARLFTYDGDKWVDPLTSLTRRVEELEQQWRVAERRKDGGVAFMRSRMTELADAMNEAGLAVGDHSRHAEMEERLKKLEEGFAEPYTRPGRPVHERTIWIHPFDSPRFKCKAEYIDYMTAFDPDASPSGVPFEVALMYAKMGRRISHPQLADGSYISINEGRLFHHYLPDGATADLRMPSSLFIGDAWRVLPKEEKA